jgi:hypothetical protein
MFIGLRKADGTFRIWKAKRASKDRLLIVSR